MIILIISVLIALVLIACVSGGVFLIRYSMDKQIRKIRDEVLQLPLDNIRDKMKEIVRRQRAHEDLFAEQEENLLAQDSRRMGQFVPQTEEEGDFGIEPIPREMVEAAHRANIACEAQAYSTQHTGCISQEKRKEENPMVDNNRFNYLDI